MKLSKSGGDEVEITGSVQVVESEDGQRSLSIPIRATEEWIAKTFNGPYRRREWRNVRKRGNLITADRIETVYFFAHTQEQIDSYLNCDCVPIEGGTIMKYCSRHSEVQ
jgi:hypothetical protein